MKNEAVGQAERARSLPVSRAFRGGGAATTAALTSDERIDCQACVQAERPPSLSACPTGTAPRSIHPRLNDLDAQLPRTITTCVTVSLLAGIALAAG